jgi:hypothetical protein
MWRYIFISFITGAACLGAKSDSPVGTWATQIAGKDQGVCYLTFSNNFTMAGYGIAVDALGPFQISGAWNLDAHGRLVGGLTQFVGGGGFGAKFHGSANHNKLRALVNSTAGFFNFHGAPAGSIPDVSGEWLGEVRQPGQKFFVTYNAALSSNTPAWFDLTGQGVNNTGTFTVTGGMLVMPDRRVAAYTISDFGTSTETDAFIGTIAAKGKRLILHGHSSDNKPVVIRAARP